MLDNSEMPVIAGLAVGTAFVVLFSTFLLASPFAFTPTSIADVDTRVLAVTDNFKEVKIFYSQYPGGEASVDRTGNEIDGSAVKYSFQKEQDNGMMDEVRMFVMIDKKTSMPNGKIYIDCAKWSEGGSGRSEIMVESNMTRVLLMTECAK